jgi:preprotein translocase subunit SecE
MEEAKKTIADESVKKVKSSDKKAGKSSDNKAEKGKAKSYWEGLKAEFGKIVWPTRATVGKQTLAVFVVCVIAGAIIAVLDYGFGAGLNFLQSL